MGGCSLLAKGQDTLQLAELTLTPGHRQSTGQAVSGLIFPGLQGFPATC